MKTPDEKIVELFVVFHETTDGWKVTACDTTKHANRIAEIWNMPVYRLRIDVPKELIAPAIEVKSTSKEPSNGPTKSTRSTEDSGRGRDNPKASTSQDSSDSSGSEARVE